MNAPRKSKKKGVNWVVLVLGLLLVLPLVWLLWDAFDHVPPHQVPEMMSGKEAPTFVLQDLDGDTWDLAALKGKPIVLNFWSTWCGPCKQEHPYLQQAAQRYPNVAFLGVIYSDTPDKCRRYLNKVGTTYDHLVDPEGAVSIDYGVAGVPETFFIDPSGKIVHKQVGPVNGPMISALVERMLANQL